MNIVIFYVFVVPLLVAAGFATIKHKYGRKILLLSGSVLLLICAVVWLVKRDILFYYSGPLAAAGLRTYALPIAGVLLMVSNYPNAKSSFMKLLQLIVTYILLVLAVLSGYWVT